MALVGLASNLPFSGVNFQLANRCQIYGTPLGSITCRQRRGTPGVTVQWRVRSYASFHSTGHWQRRAICWASVRVATKTMIDLCGRA